MRKSVRTPPILTTELASRGKPCCSWPTSVVVPPTSTTIASSRPGQVRRAAHRIGRRRRQSCRPARRCAGAASATVPSFWVMNSGAAMPEFGGSPARRRRSCRGQVGQRGIEQAGVLALEQADAPEVGEQVIDDVRDLLARRYCGLALVSSDRAARRSAEIGDRATARSRFISALPRAPPAASNGTNGRPS